MSNKTQGTALKISAVSASLFSISGITLGLISGSVMIMFDSFYSLLSLLMASISLLALRAANKPACGEYPFGRLTAEPLAILFKGVVIALVCMGSIVIALISIWQGGRAVNLDIALIFGVVNVAGCLLTWRILTFYKKQADTALLAAEIKQWQMDTWLSTAVLAGFVVAFAVSYTPWANYAIFADPVMVLIIAGYFIRIPLVMTKNAIRQILFSAPPSAVQHTVIKCMNQFYTPANFSMALVGSRLLIKVVEPIAEEKRQPLSDTLNTIGRQYQLSVSMVQVIK